MSIQPARNGERIQMTGNPAVYLVLDGELHWIPNPTTYNNLFHDTNGILQSPDAFGVALSFQLSDGAVLAKGPVQNQVYLVSNGVKRWIVSPDALAKYYFDASKIIQVPQVVLDAIQNGTNLQ